MSIFADPDAAVAEISAIRLQMISGFRGLPAAALATPAGETSYLMRKLQAAEAEVARRLAVFLEPTAIFPVTAPTSDQIAALDGMPWAIEPGYDMPDNFFTGNFYAVMQLLQRPAISVSSVNIFYPQTGQLLFSIPLDWLRLDYKHGQLSIVPGGLISSQPLSLMQMQLFFAGQNVPHMIQIQYVAGLQPTDPHVPDVQDLILRLAALRVLYDQFLPQSSSISADGLSRSASQDLGKQRDLLFEELSDMRESIRGVDFGFG